MTKHKSNNKKKTQEKFSFLKIEGEILWDNKTLGVFFLGVGIILFVLNITSMLNFMQYANLDLPMTGFYASTISAIILILYSSFNIYYS